MHAYLQDLKADYAAYVDACLNIKETPLHFNGWVQAKISDLERRLTALEKRMNECEGEK